MQDFELKTKIFFGEGSLDHLLHKKSKNAMIIADPFTVQSGIIKHVTDRLDKDGIPYKIFDNVVPDPPMDRIVLGVKAALEQMPDCLMAVGGGSAIDFTKAVKKFSHEINNDFNPKFIAIPTTSGTGSEVTQVAVVTDTEKQIKYPLEDRDLIPDEAILDAVLVKTVPRTITADTGMDIITHAIEAFTSTGRNDFSDALAERAIKLCCRFLCRSYLNPDDTEARQEIHVASCMAGVAFNAAGLGLVHGMSHQLGAHFHIPHGRLNSILLPHIIAYNSNIQDMTIPHDGFPPCAKKYCEIAASLGIINFNEVSTVRSLMNYLKILAREMEEPCCIKDIKTISKEEYFGAVPEMAAAALRDATTQTNPRVPTQEEVEALYRDIWDFEVVDKY